MVSGNKPIPMRAIELSPRIYPPILFDKIFINPMENIKERIPARIMPLLNNRAVFFRMPKSLNACCVQVNHGDEAIESPRQMKITIGIKIPQNPATRMIPDGLLSK